MWSLQVRMWLLLTVLFGIVYAIIVVIGRVFLHAGGFSFYLIISLVLMFIQYMLGPKIVEWSMRVKYIKRQDNPGLFQMVENLASRANIPVPKIGIAQIEIPNAFAFGRSLSDGRVCVTKGILNLLSDEELKAVLGHELSHLKNRDVLTITLLSVIPMIMYRIAWQFLFFGRRRDDRGGNTVLIGLAAFLFYFITNLLVLYASRIREYFADRGSLALGNQPSALASSLYKLVYGSARMKPEALKESEGLKAFFVNDPSQARNEIKELAQLDLDKSGTIDPSELLLLQNKNVRLGFGDRIMELLSTHPNMLKRIKKLSEYRG
ncbi:MAG: zinc metalloprotease HtpX [Candidatus Omnitrophica bacterium]|nr:zinc metalloprotease HtpX [Candidatus Omnitrophota bacterium]MDD5027162.1 zinc metalloprotease HtpX [Candidatus Omnitrophota bacterium]MDD5662189.1 zinc metalloprotease HtpX [Candidatus Omnitrophota bacterium]